MFLSCDLWRIAFIDSGVKYMNWNQTESFYRKFETFLIVYICHYDEGCQFVIT